MVVTRERTRQIASNIESPSLCENNRICLKVTRMIERSAASKNIRILCKSQVRRFRLSGEVFGWSGEY